MANIRAISAEKKEKGRKKRRRGGTETVREICFAVEEEGELLSVEEEKRKGKRVERNGEAGVVPQRK